jgi:hypothetical protein
MWVYINTYSIYRYTHPPTHAPAPRAFASPAHSACLRSASVLSCSLSRSWRMLRPCRCSLLELRACACCVVGGSGSRLAYPGVQVSGGSRRWKGWRSRGHRASCCASRVSRCMSAQSMLPKKEEGREGERERGGKHQYHATGYQISLMRCLMPLHPYGASLQRRRCTCNILNHHYDNYRRFTSYCASYLSDQHYMGRDTSSNAPLDMDKCLNGA